MEVYLCKPMEQWQPDLGELTSEQWEMVLEAVHASSLNTSQGLSKLYILLSVYYTPLKLIKMGLLHGPSCPKCSRDHGDLFHVL